MRWPWSRVLPVVLAVVVLLAAALAYGSVVPIHHVQRSRLAGLIVATPPAGFTTKGANAGEMAAANNPFPAVKAVATRSPDSTGAYSVAWTGSTGSSSSLSLLATMLPSVGDARTVLSQARAKYQLPNSFHAQGYAYTGALTVPSPVGATGATYIIHGAKTTQHVAVIVFRSGRTVVTEFAQEVSLAAAESAANELAASEFQHLSAIGSAVSLRTTRWPVTATVVWWAVAGVLAGAVVGMPAAVRRARRLRLERQARNARKAFQGRGSKIAKRQAAHHRR